MQGLPGAWRKGKGRGFLLSSSKEEVMQSISKTLRRSCGDGYSHLCSETLLGQDSCYLRMMPKRPHGLQEDCLAVGTSGGHSAGSCWHVGRAWDAQRCPEIHCATMARGKKKEHFAGVLKERVGHPCPRP